MQGDHERETESQQQRVSHPSEAGRRIQEPRGKQKVNNKESVTPGRRIQEPRGKQKVNNKESVTPESYLSIYLSIDPSIHPSIHPSIYLSI